jgi:hypothetical protein
MPPSISANGSGEAELGLAADVTGFTDLRRQPASAHPQKPDSTYDEKSPNVNHPQQEAHHEVLYHLNAIRRYHEATVDLL